MSSTFNATVPLIYSENFQGRKQIKEKNDYDSNLYEYINKKKR